MKKKILMLAFSLSLALTANCQLFSLNNRNNNRNAEEDYRDYLQTPTGNGNDEGANVPIGSGVALLVGGGAAYLLVKKRK